MEVVRTLCQRANRGGIHLSGERLHLRPVSSLVLSSPYWVRTLVVQLSFQSSQTESGAVQ